MNVFFLTLYAFFQALPFVLAVVLAVSFCLFCLGAYNSPVIAVSGAAALYFLSQIGGNPELPLGLNLSLVDFYFLLLGLVFAIRLLTGHLQTHDRVVRLWLLMAAVWILLLLVGLVQYKTAAGVEFRSTYYILTTVLYLFTFKIDAFLAGRIFKVLYNTGLAFALLSIYRWISYAMGEVGPWFDPHTPLRVLDSSGAMFIGLSMLPGMAMWMGLNTKKTDMMFIAPLLFLVMVVLGHRTVWIVSLAALGAAWWMAGRKNNGGGQAGFLLPLAMAVLILGALFVLAPKSTVTQEFERSVAETQQKNSTLAWRVDSWKSLIDDWVAGGPLVWPAGKPFGTSNRRFIESQGMETTVGAHSLYITLLIRGGLLVLVSYVAVQIVAVRRLLNRPVAAPDWLGGELLAVFIIANLIYGISYSIDYTQAMFLGLAYAIAAQAGAVPLSKPAPAGSIRTPIARHASRRPAHLP
jgi:O-antigen ligase